MGNVKTGHGWDCPACSDEVEILSTAGPDDECEDGSPAVFFEGDKARCPSCDWRGSMGACEGDAWVNEGNLEDLDDDGHLTPTPARPVVG